MAVCISECAYDSTDALMSLQLWLSRGDEGKNAWHIAAPSILKLCIMHYALCIKLSIMNQALSNRYLITFMIFCEPSVISITMMFTPWNGVSLSIPAAL